MTDTVTDATVAHALLSDGRTIQIRRVMPADREQIRALYAGMSAENVRLRFFGAGPRLGEQAVERVCTPDRSPGSLALLALHGEQVVGIAEYATINETGTAEVALAVADAFHHKGVGTLLLEHLAYAALTHGITAFTADALPDNRAMLDVFAHLGLPVEHHIEDGQVHCAIHLNAGEQYRRAVDERGRIADLASLNPLLRPALIAVVGAGRSPDSVGRSILRNLSESRFPGPLYAVNPHADALGGTRCFPTVSALPHVPELVVVAVPAHSVASTARECGKWGVRALVVVSAGLDADQAPALLAACRRYDMRLLGPNCLGIANTEDAVRMNATFAARPPAVGSAGVAVQSGGVGIALLAGLSRLDIGVSSFLSLGDKYDVSGNDTLQWWESDSRTDLALLHLESFGNPRAFSRTARRVTRC